MINDQPKAGRYWDQTNTALADGHIDWVELAKLVAAGGYEGAWSLKTLLQSNKGLNGWRCCLASGCPRTGWG